MGTLNRLERLKRSQQAATRIACWVAVLGIAMSSNASAYAPTIKRQPTIQMTAKMYAKANLPLDQYKCINKLYYYESRWNDRAYNKSSGTAGIPQGKSKWLLTASPIQQVKWGIKYNKHRYGSMCKALEHFKRNNWH